MSDVNTEELINSLNSLGGSLSKWADEADDSVKRRQAANRDANKKIKETVTGTASALRQLTGSFKEASGMLATFFGGAIIGGAVKGMLHQGEMLTETYRELAQSGNDFGGSILGMATAAARAGIPLEEFSKGMRKSSIAIHSMTKGDYPSLQRQMRASMVQFGNFGMSVGEITEYSSAQLEIYRSTGALQKMTNGQFADSMIKNAQITQSMTMATGKARDAIAQLTSSAIENSLTASRIGNLPENQRKAATDGIEKITTIFAGQAGKAGDFLSGAIANTYGNGGQSEFTQEGKALNEAGLGGLLNKLNHLSQTLNPDEAIAFSNSMKDELQNNYSALQNMAKGGNAAAEQMLRIFPDLKKLSPEELKKKQEYDGVTKFFLTIETIWDGIMGNFKEGFMKGLKPFADSVGDITRAGWVKTFGDKMKSIGEQLGSFVTADNLAKAGAIFSAIWSGMSLFAEGILWTASLFSSLGGKLKYVVDGVGIIAAVLLGLKAFRSLKSLVFGSKMIIQAKSVIVNGGIAGGAGGAGGLAGGLAGAAEALGPNISNMGRITQAFKGASRAAGGGVGGLIQGLVAGTKTGGGLLGGKAGGLLKGLTKGKMLGGAALGAGMESLDYIFGDKALSLKNLAKTGLSLTGGALGGALGSLLPTGATTVLGGVAGYSAGSMAGDWLFGDDDKKHVDKLADASQNMQDALKPNDDADSDGSDSNSVMAKQLENIQQTLKDQNDILVNGAKSHAARLDDQTDVLKKINSNTRS